MFLLNLFYYVFLNRIFKITNEKYLRYLPKIKYGLKLIKYKNEMETTRRILILQIELGCKKAPYQRYII